MNTIELISLILGSTSMISVASFIIYNWRITNCSSHITLGNNEIAMNIKEVLEQPNDEYKKELGDKVKSIITKMKNDIQYNHYK